MRSMLAAMLRAHGVLRVAHGPGRAACVLARVLRLPRAGAAVDTRLVVTETADGEEWRRTFDDRQLDSRQRACDNGEMVERFRYLELRFVREASDGGVAFRQLGAALVFGPLRLPLPRVCAPRVIAREDPGGPGDVHVDVRVELPGVGSLLRYDGTVHIEAPR